jgi:hypothetical protein
VTVAGVNRRVVLGALAYQLEAICGGTRLRIMVIRTKSSVCLFMSHLKRCGGDHRQIIMRRSSAAGGSSDAESVASSVSLRERLPDNIQKALAELLEASGGIRSFRGHWHKLATLCDQKFEEDRTFPFGRRADPIRRKLQSKVLKWQSKEEKGLYTSDRGRSM